VLLAVGMISDKYPSRSPEYEGLTRFGGLFFVSALLIMQMVRRPQRRALLAGLFVLIAFSDLTRYFLEANIADHSFTPRVYPRIPFPFPPDAQADLNRSWPPGDPAQGFMGGVDRSLPISMDLWPDNVFLRPFHVQEVWAMDEGRESLAVPMPDVRFVPAGPM